VAGAEFNTHPAATPHAPVTPGSRTNQAATVSDALVVPPALQDKSLQVAAIGELPVNPLRHSLPSRLAVLSMAVEGRLIVAIDTGSNVFLSKDGGRHWKQVHAPWQSKAVTAALVDYPASSPTIPSRESPGYTTSASGGSVTPTDVPKGEVIAKKSLPLSSSGSSLTGKVTDRAGAVIGGASVTVTDPAAPISRTAKTDGGGRYRFDGIAPGSYRVEASALGFATQMRTVVVEASAGPPVVDLVLNVGAAAETVQVQVASSSLEVEPARLDADSTRLKENALKQTGDVAAGVAREVFEIVTRNGERWSSVDGLHWKRR
jgi:hypothetical protein